MGSALLIVLAAYVYFSGIQRTSPGSSNYFLCGSGANPPQEAFPKAVCGYLNHNRVYQALAYIAAAVILAAGGLWTFTATPAAAPAESEYGEDDEEA